MASKQTNAEKRKAVVQTLRSIIESYDSHLDWAVERNPREKDPRTFHVQCCIQYAEDILRLTKTLK